MFWLFTDDSHAFEFRVVGENEYDTRGVFELLDGTEGVRKVTLVGRAHILTQSQVMRDQVTLTHSPQDEEAHTIACNKEKKIAERDKLN